MSESFSPRFVDLDPVTGEPTPTTHESMRVAFYRTYAISKHLPEPIRKELHTAVDMFSLAYGQANANQVQLYNPLTDNAFLSAMRAFELALRDRLACPASTPLVRLIEQAMQQGRLPNGVHDALFYHMLRENRNAATHGQGERHVSGLFLGPIIGVVIILINHLYKPSPAQA